MSRIESYHDVLSEKGRRDNIVSSAWIVAAALCAAIILFV
jgi:hypothetical protein